MYMKIPGFIEIDAGHKPDCEGVDEIELVNCKKVGARTFENCRWLKKISLPECTEVGDEAFFGCTQLTEVSIPKCEIIGYGAFTGCGIKEIVLPSCTQLADFAFQGCTKLEKIDLPVCKNIGFAIAGNYGGNVSVNCPQWEKIVSYYPWAYSHNWRKAFTALLGESCLGMVPKVVEMPICTSVADGIFSGCSHLRKIDMPKCKTIGVESFYRCSGLEEVNLPTCSSIGKNAFSGCENLKEIHFAKESRGKIVGLSDSGLIDSQCFYDLQVCEVGKEEKRMEKKEMAGVNSAQWKDAEAMWETWNEERQLAFYRKSVAAGAVDADLILHPMSEFDAVLAGTPPLEIARMALEGDFDLWSEYFYIDCAKNLVSVCSADLPDFLELVSDDVIRYMAMHPEASAGESTKI